MKKNCHSETIKENRGSYGHRKNERKKRDSSHSFYAKKKTEIKNIRKHIWSGTEIEKSLNHNTEKTQRTNVLCAFGIGIAGNKKYNTMRKV